MGWLSGWNYRKSHVIGSASGAGTNYQIRIKVYYGSGTDSGENVYLGEKCRTDFGDVRFTDDDGTTLLDYWMQEKVDSSYAIFWVEVADDLSSNSATIYVYYGKSDATTTSSLDATFIFGQDFRTEQSISSSKWETSGSPSISWDSNGLIMTKTGGRAYLKSVNAYDFSSLKRVLAEYKFGDSTGNWDCGVFVCAQITLDGATDWVRHLQYSASTVPWLQKMVGGTSSTLVNLLLNGLQYHKHDLRLKTASTGYIRYSVDDTQRYYNDAETLYNYANNYLYAYVSANTGYTRKLYMKYIAVAKFVDPEPAHDSWGSEEQPSGQLYELYVDAISQSLTTPAYETIYNVMKDASVAGQSLNAQETTFAIEKDIMVKAVADVIVEKVAGLLVEIFKDAIAVAQASFTLESTFNISPEAAAQALAPVNVEAVLNIVKDAIIQAFATPRVVGIYPISRDVLVNASATATLQQILSVKKDSVVVAVSMPLMQSIFNITPEAVVKVLAEVAIIKEGEVKVTRLFLVLGDLAIQIQGS